MLIKKDIVLYLTVIVLGFVGMGAWRFCETIWNDHNQIGENTTQIETNGTNVQAVINYLNQQGAAFQQVPVAPVEPAEPADPEPEPDPTP